MREARAYDIRGARNEEADSIEPQRPVGFTNEEIDVLSDLDDSPDLLDSAGRVNAVLLEVTSEIAQNNGQLMSLREQKSEAREDGNDIKLRHYRNEIEELEEEVQSLEGLRKKLIARLNELEDQ